MARSVMLKRPAINEMLPVMEAIKDVNGSLRNRPALIPTLYSRRVTRTTRGTSCGGSPSVILPGGVWCATRRWGAHLLRLSSWVRVPINHMVLNTQPQLFSMLTKLEIGMLPENLTGDDRRVALVCLSTSARRGKGSPLRCEWVNHGRVMFLKI